MKKRRLGNSSLEVAPWAFGGNVFGWTVDEKQSFLLLDAFTDEGFNLVDTADVYSVWVPGNKGGDSEEIIGKWLQKTKKREKVVIATKVGMDMGNGHKGLSPKHILRSVDQSLKRLKTDYIDLYQAHEDDPETPLEETLEAFDQLKKAGKVREIGASNYTAARLKEALECSKNNGFASYVSLQPQYNLYDREGYEKELEALCLSHHLGVITYYSLASGFLTGKYRREEDFRNSNRAGAKKYLNKKGLQLLDAVDEVAASYNTSPASVAIAWLMQRPGITAPIASATKLAQLQQIVTAANLDLNQEALDLLNQNY